MAEVGSAMLCGELGITQDVRADHAQYLAQWLELMKEDSKAIFTAAAAAGRAVDFLKGLQPQEPHSSPPLSKRPEPPGRNAGAKDHGRKELG